MIRLTPEEFRVERARAWVLFFKELYSKNNICSVSDVALDADMLLKQFDKRFAPEEQSPEDFLKFFKELYERECE